MSFGFEFRGSEFDKLKAQAIVSER